MLVLQLALALSSREEAEFVVPLFVERFELEALFRLDCVSPPYIGEGPYHAPHAHMTFQSAADLGYTHTCVFVCVYTCTCVCVCVCVYIYIYG